MRLFHSNYVMRIFINSKSLKIIMAKIAIYEDDVEDIISRYSKLNDEHNISLRIEQGMRELRNRDLELLGDYGFSISDIKEYSEEELRNGEMDTDIYFIGGLRGDWFNVARYLPIGKVIVNSGDSMVREQAEKKGYKTLEGESVTGSKLSELLSEIN